MAAISFYRKIKYGTENVENIEDEVRSRILVRNPAF
jgi:hypothetical protein